MRLAILGTGTLASALGKVWAGAGHEVFVAELVGGTAVSCDEAVAGMDAVLLAVSWSGVSEMLALVGGPEDRWAGTTLIDPTNPVAHGEGVLLTPAGRSAAQEIAELAPGAHVVKAFNLFAASQWQGAGTVERVSGAMCGDDAGALAVVGQLIEDAGGAPVRLGPLTRARQLEEAAGFVIGLVLAGVDPRGAVPRVPARAAN